MSVLTVDVVRRGPARRIPIREFKAKARRILRLLDQDDCELSIALVGDGEIRDLNGRYRSRDEPTDVLSFPVDKGLPSGPRLIGDVIISVEKAARQARQRRRSLEDELEVLLIHGILHNLGYDHERSPEDEREMRALERRLRRELKAGAPLSRHSRGSGNPGVRRGTTPVRPLPTPGFPLPRE